MPEEDSVGDLFNEFGRVEVLRFALDYEEHQVDRGHGVSMTEVLSTLAIRPRFFLNRGANRSAPVVMLGETALGRVLMVPIAPTETSGCWTVLTAYDAGANDRARYLGDRHE